MKEVVAYMHDSESQLAMSKLQQAYDLLATSCGRERLSITNPRSQALEAVIKAIRTLEHVEATKGN